MAVFSQATAHALVPANGQSLRFLPLWNDTYNELVADSYPNPGHHLTLEDDILPSLELSSNIHVAPTKLICLENTLGGTIFPQEEIVKIGECAKKNGIPLHLDGARLWEVAANVMRKEGVVVDEQGLGKA